MQKNFESRYSKIMCIPTVFKFFDKKRKNIILLKNNFKWMRLINFEFINIIYIFF